MIALSGSSSVLSCCSMKEKNLFAVAANHLDQCIQFEIYFKRRILYICKGSTFQQKSCEPCLTLKNEHIGTHMNSSPHNMFRDQLTRMDMLPLYDGEPTGLFFVSEKSKHPHIHIALEQAERYGADAVFFRMFPDDVNRFPLPQIYIYDDTTLVFDDSKYAEIHQRLWYAGVVPLVFIFTATEVKVLNCRREPEVDPVTQKLRLSPFTNLEALVRTEQALVTRRIATGTLWDDPELKNEFMLQSTAYYKLLTNLKVFRKELIDQCVLPEEIANRLLVMAILVKYLDDRRDPNGNRVFQDGFFKQFSNTGRDDFASLFLERGSCVKLFDNLSKHFNGGIFELREDDRTLLQQADLTPVATFLKGDQELTGQRRFWPLYSFQDLPVELISNIYEEFLAKQGREKSKGVVYTPPMLVDFLLDQCVPLDPKTLEWKILDPACGSGIFLVGAFKRLIHCWRVANDWKLPGLSDLKNILKNNIFGVDDKSEAVLVTAFSLCAALCNELDPLVIWNELKFDDLRISNLQARDFFQIIESNEFAGSFDLIIGNPPFDSTLTTASAKSIENERIKQRPEIPDQQLALLFLEQSFQLCREEGKVCLIQPAGPLLYNGNGQSFRKYLFDRFQPDCVFDFTALDKMLFSKVKVASAAILVNNSPEHGDKVLHITFRRTKAIKERLLFELDPYDFHWIPRDVISKNPYLWKVNLLGGGRLHRLMERLFTDTPTLGKYLEEKCKRDGWQVGEGYSVGSGNKPNSESEPNRQQLKKLSPKELKDLFDLNRTAKTADWLTGKDNVPPEALTRHGIDWESVKPCGKDFFEETREGLRTIFSPPHVLIREYVDGLATGTAGLEMHSLGIPACFSNQELVFTKQIIGIHADPKDEDKLRDLARRLNDSRLYGILAVVVSGRALVSWDSSLLQSDIMALPYPEDIHHFDLNYWENALIEDINDCLIDFRRKGEGSSALYATDESDLNLFGEMYCRVLNAIYEKFHPLQPLYLGSFICFPICFGDTPYVDLPEEDVGHFLRQLLHRKLGNRLLMNRILRIYEQNVIFLIKPNQKRYWLRSIALRDADETLIDLLEQGY